MGTDIGAKIGIDGEAAFRSSLAAINSQLKNLGSEMKSVISAFSGMENSEGAVTAKGDVLKRSLNASAEKMKLLQNQSERAKARLATLSDELEKSKQKFGENSEEARKAQDAYNKQVVVVNRLETQMNQTTTQMNRMKQEMQELGNSSDALSKDLDKTEQSSARMKAAMKATMKVATSAVAAAVGTLSGLGIAAIKVGSDFEESMSQVAATMGMSVSEIHNGSEAYETLATAAKNAGATTKFTATQAAEALNYLALAGYDAGTSAEVLPSVLNLAAAGGLDLAYASDLATDAMAALGIEANADNLTQFGDEMAMASSKANYSVAQLGEAILTVGGTAKNLAGGTVELNAALGVLANRGVKGAEGGTALRNIILSLSAPTDTAAATLKSLGVSAFDAEGNLRPLNETFRDLDTAMQSLTQEKKTNALNDIFNKVDLKSAEAMLAGCGAEFDNLAYSIENSSGAMQDMADVQMDNLKGQITLLQSAVEGLGVAFYENMNGKIKDAVSATTGYVSELNAVMNAAFADAENEENVKQVTKALTELGYSAEEAQSMVGTGMSGVVSSLGGILAQAMADITNAAPALLDAGVQLIASFLQGIQENGDSLAAGALSIVGTLAEGIAELLPMVADTAASLIVSLADGLTESLPQMVPVAAEMLTSLVENLTENADTILQAGVGIIEALDEGLVNALPKLVETVPQLLLKISEVLNENAAQIMDAAMQLMMHLADGLVQAIPTLIETVPQIVINIANIINDNAPKLIDTALYLITRLATGLLAATPTILANIPKIIEAIVAAFMAFQWLNLGKQLIDGVANGVKKAGESMATAAKNAFSKFKSKITGSEVATELKNIGKYIIDGIVGGIKNSLSSIANIAGKIKDALLSKLKGLFKIHSPSRVMRDEVGKQIPAGVAVGIEDGTGEAVEAAEQMAEEVAEAAEGMDSMVAFAQQTARKVGDVLKSELEKTNREIETLQKKSEEKKAAEELKEYKDNLAKKRAELKKAEKKNRQKIQDEITKLESDWNKKQEDAAKTAEEKKLKERLSALQTFQKEYESALSKIESKQSSLQEKLADYGSLFERVKTEDDKELFQLGDLDAEIRKIRKYSDAIEEMQAKGLSAGLMSEISAMSVDDALDYMDKLSHMSDVKLQEYIQKYEEKQQLAAEAAKKFYQSEFDALEQNYTEKLPQTLGEVKDELYQAGTEAAKSFTEGMKENGGAKEAVSKAVANAAENTQGTTMKQVVASLQAQEPVLTEYVQAMEMRLTEVMTSYRAQYVSIGEMMMEGFAKGIQNGKSGVINAVAEVVAAAIAKAKSKLDIHSPSGVFEGFGAYSMEGYEIGIKDKMKSVMRTVQNSMDAVARPPRVETATGGISKSQTYTYGDINVHIDSVKSEREARVVAEQIEFLRRQQNTGRGGN